MRKRDCGRGVCFSLSLVPFFTGSWEPWEGTQHQPLSNSWCWLCFKQMFMFSFLVICLGVLLRNRRCGKSPSLNPSSFLQKSSSTSCRNLPAPGLLCLYRHSCSSGLSCGHCRGCEPAFLPGCPSRLLDKLAVWVSFLWSLVRTLPVLLINQHMPSC